MSGLSSISRRRDQVDIMYWVIRVYLLVSISVQRLPTAVPWARFSSKRFVVCLPIRVRSYLIRADAAVVGKIGVFFTIGLGNA
jgi:hypothetical protein